MKRFTICYIARHDQIHSNDDEGAITYALEKQGHRVQRLRELRASSAAKVECDFYLVHSLYDMNVLRGVTKPVVFWYFDLVDYPDGSLKPRCKKRVEWIRSMTQRAALGFCTDGDWVRENNTGKLYHLFQGADGRKVGMAESIADNFKQSLLFTGIHRGGTDRESFVEEMITVYGSGFRHISKGVYGESLKVEIANTQIVVAPDAPVTNHYCSNRVFITLGFGGFLLHPYCATLAKMYESHKEIVYYNSRKELHELIGYYGNHPEERQQIAKAGYERTLAENLYEHRVQTLTEIVGRRLFS